MWRPPPTVEQRITLFVLAMYARLTAMYRAMGGVL